MTLAWHAPDQIRAEHDLGSNLRQADIDALMNEGVPPLALVRQADGESSLLLRDRVIFEGDRFEFGRYVRHDGAGVSAFTLLAINERGEAIDIVAWRPPTLASWLGRAAVLGAEQVLAPRLAEPLRVHASVMGWLRAGREGVFVVDHAQAAWMLRTESLGVETVEHARALRKHLTIAAPPIRVIRSPNVDNIHDRDRPNIVYNVHEVQGAAA